MLIDTWLANALLFPYRRQPILNIFGKRGSGKTALCKFLRGYFLPYPWINIDTCEHAVLLDGVVLCFTSEISRMQALRDPEVIVIRPGRFFDNTTQWIYESMYQFNDVSFELTEQLDPLLAQSAIADGVLMRRSGIMIDTVSIMSWLNSTRSYS